MGESVKMMILFADDYSDDDDGDDGDGGDDNDDDDDDDDDCYHCHVCYVIQDNWSENDYRLLSWLTEKNPILQLRRKITCDTMNHIVMRMMENKIKNEESGGKSSQPNVDYHLEPPCACVCTDVKPSRLVTIYQANSQSAL